LTVRAIFESDKEIDVPTKERNDKRFYVLEKGGTEYFGRPPERYGPIAFTIPFENVLLGFKFTSMVTIQVNGKRSIIVICDYVDFEQIYNYLKTTFDCAFRLKKYSFSADFQDIWDSLKWDDEYLEMSLTYAPAETLSFVAEHYKEILTANSLRNIPRKFNQQLIHSGFIKLGK
jgi:hypothetical protein